MYFNLLHLFKIYNIGSLQVTPQQGFSYKYVDWLDL